MTSNGLPLNGSGPVAKVHTMMGFMRDDGAAFISYPVGSSPRVVLTSDSYRFRPVPISLRHLNKTSSHKLLLTIPYSLFPMARMRFSTPLMSLLRLPRTSNLGALTRRPRLLESNTTYSRVSGFMNSIGATKPLDSTPTFHIARLPLMLCIPWAIRTRSTSSRVIIEISGLIHSFFLKLRRCHSGELYYVFGTLPSTTTRPYRDNFDLPFMQETLDIWTSFARTFNPNPDSGFLRARGFEAVAEHLSKQERWSAVAESNLHGASLRVLQWESFMTRFEEVDQCDFLGFPLTFYD